MTPEQKLAALEKSKDEPSVQLNLAFDIAKLNGNPANWKYARDSNVSQLTETNDFRQQWLLKWMLKRLNEAIESSAQLKHDTLSKSFVFQQKTWILLIYLLKTIKQQTSVGILLERNFTVILSEATKIALHASTSVNSSESSPVDSSAPIDRDTGRSYKKRRLSQTHGEQLDGQPRAGVTEVNALILAAADAFAVLLEGSARPSNGSSRGTVPTWAKSAIEASILVGYVIELAVTESQLQSSSNPTTSVVAPTVSLWLNLWNEYSVSSNVLEKHLLHEHFIGSCLNPSLDLLGILDNSSETDATRSVRQILEHHIAIHSIIPLRSYFIADLSKAWKADRDVYTWTDVESIYSRSVTLFRKALHTETLAGIEFISFKKTAYASQLFNIASRLIPRDDVRRRQWERPWLEAIFMSLCYLTFPKELYRLEKNQNGQLDLPINALPPNLHGQVSWPIEMLDTLLQQQTNLSSPVSSYLITAVLLFSGQSPPTAVLSKLIQIDASSFIPQSDAANSAHCLTRLLNVIDEKRTLTEDERNDMIQTVVVPLMQGFAKQRDLQGFTKAWLPHLEDAFRARNSNGMSSESFDCALLWDDDDIFYEFEFLCHHDPARSFITETTDVVARELRSIAQRVGPTIDILAKVAILDSALRGRRSEVILSNMNMDNLSNLAAAVVTSLQQNNDYQSHRWRLWSLLNTIYEIDPALPLAEDLARLISQQSPIIDFKWNTVLQDTKDYKFSAQYKEYFQAFQSLVRHNRKDEPTLSNELNRTVQQISQLLVAASASLHENPTSRNSYHSLSWDGHMNHLNSMGELLCACLTCLLGNPEALNRASIQALSPPLQKIAYDTLKQPGFAVSTPGSLGQIATALFTAFDQDMGRSTFCVLVEDLIKDNDPIVPPVLHSLSLHHINKEWANETSQSIFGRVKKLYSDVNSAGLEHVMAYLALLTRLVVEFPVSIGNPDNFYDLATLVHLVDLNGASCTVELQCFGRIIEVFQNRAMLIDDSARKTTVHKNLSHWTQQHASRGQSKRNKPSAIERHLCTVVESLLVGEKSTASLVPSQDALQEQVHTNITHVISFNTSNKSLTNGSLHAAMKKDIVVASQLEGGRKDEALKTSRSDLSDLTRTQSFSSIAALVTSFSKDELRSMPDAIQMLAQIASLKDAIHSEDKVELLLKLEISNLVLNRQTEIVNQATIDDLLSSLALLSSSGSSLAADSASNLTNQDDVRCDAIYSKLLELVGSLLTRYRRRLNGRTHLLLPVIQNLLKCLFYTPDRAYIYHNPATARQKQAFRKSLPPWLLESNEHQLSASAADKFSRILSSICNPTTASARSAHRGQKRAASALELNDEIQQARRFAAQYMQYVIVEYTKSTLDGVLRPEVKDKLTPGLYMVLDAMDRDLMRAMNAMMDPSSRAIFKSLYEDWVRFGKWNQT